MVIVEVDWGAVGMFIRDRIFTPCMEPPSCIDLAPPAVILVCLECEVVPPCVLTTLDFNSVFTPTLAIAILDDLE